MTVSDPLDTLEEEANQKGARRAAHEARRYLDCLTAEGFHRDEALRIVIAWTGRPGGMSPQDMERIFAAMNAPA